MTAGELIQQGARWTRTRRDLALDALRVYLGVALSVRGGLMLSAPDLLTRYVAQADWFWPAFVTHYVIGAHIVGGLCLALGLRTRLAAASQLPALLGAVFVVHLGEGLLLGSQALELSALVLFMLLVFSIFGSGRYSLDHYLSKTAAGAVPDLEPQAA